MIISTFFSNIMLLLLFLYLVVSIDWPGHFPPQIHIESHSSFNHCPVFYLKAAFWPTSPFREKSGGSQVSSLFLGNSRQHIAVCAQIISSSVRKSLSTAKAHMSQGILQDAMTPVALAADVSQVSIQQAGDWPRISIPARFYFLTYITTTHWPQHSAQCVVLGLSE